MTAPHRATPIVAQRVRVVPVCQYITARAQPAGRLVPKRDGALVGAQEREHRPQQRRLAGTVRTDHQRDGVGPRRDGEAAQDIDAGQVVLIGPSTVFLIASRLAGPGAMANSFGRAINVGIVNDRASLGTSSSDANAPSFTC